jgi:hypothetical protein
VVTALAEVTAAPSAARTAEKAEVAVQAAARYAAMITAALPAVEAPRELVVAEVLRINASSIVKQHLHRQQL